MENWIYYNTVKLERMENNIWFMKTENIERYLNSVGKKVVNQSKGNLQRAGKGGKLEESIYFKVVPEGDGFVLQFYEFYNFNLWTV